MMHRGGFQDGQVRGNRFDDFVRERCVVKRITEQFRFSVEFGIIFPPVF